MRSRGLSGAVPQRFASLRGTRDKQRIAGPDVMTQLRSRTSPDALGASDLFDTQMNDPGPVRPGTFWLRCGGYARSERERNVPCRRSAPGGRDGSRPLRNRMPWLPGLGLWSAEAKISFSLAINAASANFIF